MKKLLVFVFSVVFLGSCSKKGCTDQNATNYSSEAVDDDGSCVFTYTNIPDTAFEQTLIDGGLDDVLDGKVLTHIISEVENIYIIDSNITNLTGIEDFVGLKMLTITATNISALILSNHPQLKYLYCSYNLSPITTFDVSNLNLETLHCEGNMLSGNLDLSNHTSLSFFSCLSNDLSCINISNGNNENFINSFNHRCFNACENPNLSCVKVDNPSWWNANMPQGLNPGMYCVPNTGVIGSDCSSSGCF